MHQASPPLADRPARSVHSRAPEATPPEAQPFVGSSLRAMSAPSDRPRRGVAQTSAEAFRSLPMADYLAPKERAVLALFVGPTVQLSRQQISERLPMPINGVCGRVDSLLAAGHLEECGDRIDPLTRKRQKLLRLPRAAQRSLFREMA